MLTKSKKSVIIENVKVEIKNWRRAFLFPPRRYQQYRVLGVSSANQFAALAVFGDYLDKYHLNQLVGAPCVNYKKQDGPEGYANIQPSLTTVNLIGG